MSKLFLIAYTKILAKENADLQINCCCPGYVATDMSSHRGTKTAQEGAVTPTLLATLIDPATGQFWSEGRQVVW
jgi:carbonyl reductase 1